MAGVQAGEACALEELVARFWDPLVSYAVHVLESTDAAEDVVQETFARVWRRRGHWDSAGSVSAFLYVTTRRLALNERRRLRRRRLFLRAHRDEIGEPIQPAGDPSSADVRHAVDAAIASLPARQREIFTLARFHRLTHAEIAETLGISPATVSNHMTAALRRLRVLLEGARTPD